MSHDAETRFGRQLFVLSISLLLQITKGIILAFPSVLTPALLSKNATDITATSDQASWIATSNAIGGFVGFFVFPTVMDVYGRKIVLVVLNLTIITGWFIFVFAPNIATLVVARLLQGVTAGGRVIIMMIVSEYCHPKRRGYFIGIMKLCASFGGLICHGFGLFMTWRQIAGFAIIFNGLSLIFGLFCPESPPYLAMRGRFEECTKSFRWLNGKTENQDELKDLIISQMKRRDKAYSQDTNFISFMLKTFKAKDFRRSLVISLCLAFLLEAVGRHYFFAYVIQIMISVLGDKSIAVYCSLCLDCVNMLGILGSCFIVKKFKRRSVLFSFGSVGTVLIFTISLLEYLKIKFVVLSSVAWLTPLFIIIFGLTVNLSVAPLCYILLGEVFSLEHRGIGSSIAVIFLTCSYGLTLKLFPIFLETTGLIGTDIICGVCMMVCLSILYFTLPETKDRTLLDIENEMKGEGVASHPEIASMIHSKNRNDT